MFGAMVWLCAISRTCRTSRASAMEPPFYGGELPLVCIDSIVLQRHFNCETCVCAKVGYLAYRQFIESDCGRGLTECSFSFLRDDD